MEIFKSIMECLTPALALVLSTIALYYLNRFLKGKADQAQIDGIDRAVAVGIAAAEEQARKLLKVSAPMSSETKLDTAAAKAAAEIKGLDLPPVPPERLKTLIEASLNDARPLDSPPAPKPVAP